MCCRVESTGAGAPVMFVPCALLDAADEPLRACNRAGGVASSFQSIHEDTERGLSRLDRVVAPELRTWREGTGEPGRWVTARMRQDRLGRG